MKGRYAVPGRRRRFAACGVAVLSVSVFVMASPADAHVIGHSGASVGSVGVLTAGASVNVSPTSLTFPTQRAGTDSGVPKTVTVTNSGSVAVVFSGIANGSGTGDYFGSTTCFDHASLAVGASCTITIFFLPSASGTRNDTLLITDNAAGSPQKVALSGKGVEGYYLAGALGGVAAFGDAVLHGDATSIALNSLIISIKTTSNGDGYWLLGSDGGIFSYGNARFFGSTGGMRLNQPVVGMERTVDGHGYWLVASDGGIFSFGDARFFGSTGSMRLNQPVVGMARTPTGNGYWLVARDGGIFSFGDARFFGSTGSIRLNQPIVGMVARPNANGYWMHASDGGLFAFGDAPFLGSAVGAATGTFVDMAATPDGRGYWLVSNSGAVRQFGNASALGSLPFGATDVVGIAPTSPPVPFLLS
jgi:hypothetical protein